MVEAGGQHIRGFRHGLDYAFIRRSAGAPLRMRSVLSSSIASPILVPAPGFLEPSASL